MLPQCWSLSSWIKTSPKCFTKSSSTAARWATADRFWCAWKANSLLWNCLREWLRAWCNICLSAVLRQLAPDQGMVPADHLTELRRRCEEEAQQMVQMSGISKDGQQGATNSRLTHLISRLTALLLQIKVQMCRDLAAISFSFWEKVLFGSCRLTLLVSVFQCLADGGDLNSFEFKSLTDSLNDIKASIDPSNLR